MTPGQVPQTGAVPGSWNQGPGSSPLGSTWLWVELGLGPGKANTLCLTGLGWPHPAQLLT